MLRLTETPNNDSLSAVSIRIKQLGLTLLLQTIRLFNVLFKTMWWLLRLVLKPLLVIAIWLITPAVILVYTWYLKVLTRLKRSAFMQNKILFVFGNKYFIHVIVMMITVFVASTNVLQAQAVQEDVFAQHSALYKIVNPDSEVNNDIIETGLIRKTPNRHGSYIDTSGLMVATVPNLDPTAEPVRSVGEQLALANQSSALVSSNSLQTSVGNRSGITEYKVREGDTVGTIAQRFGLTISSVLLANNLNSTSYIKPGDTLKILPSSGVLYTIVSGDTLEAVVNKYKGDLNETIKINDINAAHTIAVGTQIVIVNGTPPPPPTPPVSSYFANRSSDAGNTYQPTNAAGHVTAGQFNWPVGCHAAMTTYWGHPDRARDLPCPLGTPIYAATDGTVSIRHSGCINYVWGCGGGYGNYIDITTSGIMTRYAHQQAFNVQNGQYVHRGDVIGFVGMTGNTTGPHLHFEIQLSGTFVDPIGYLKY